MECTKYYNFSGYLSTENGGKVFLMHERIGSGGGDVVDKVKWLPLPFTDEGDVLSCNRLVIFGKGGRWFKRKYSLTKDLVRYSFEPCQDSRDWMHLGHYTM
jgi:hypothetical protein